MVNPKIYIQPGEIGTLNKSMVSFEVTGSSKESIVNNKTSNTPSFNAEKFNDDTGSKVTDKIKISRWGSNNLFPNDLKNLYSNNIVPGLLDFKQDMFFGSGPYLFQLDANNKEIFINDKDVLAWLESWDYEDFLIASFADAALTENVFAQYILNKGKNKISKIVFVEAEECRLSVKNQKTGKSDFIVVNDWKNNSLSQAVPYPVFNKTVPLANQKSLSMVHKKKKSSGFRYYALPSFVGMLPKWIPLANAIPSFHLSRLERGLNVKYHIKIPVKSLQSVKEMRKFNDDQLQDWLSEKLSEIDTMLSSAENTAKTFYSFTEHDSNGKEMAGWEIKLIDNNEKEMSEANLQLYNETNQAITSAMQVQPSLASIQLGNKMSSGSEVLNSFNLHVKTRTTISRRMVLSIINDAIKINWPSKDVKLGIMDPILVKQEVSKSGLGDE